MSINYGKPISIRGLQLQITDALLIGIIILFSLLTILYHSRITGWAVILLLNILVISIYLISILWSQKMSPGIGFFLVRTTSVQLMFFYLFSIVQRMQLVFHSGWKDQLVLDLEYFIFGSQPTLWLQHFINPGLTEWFMFSYVMYIPIYPILAAIIYFKFDKIQLENYFFVLGLTNVICFLGFIIFPVASPMYMIADLFEIPLKGYLFTAIGEFIRSHLHTIGGSIPSPHAAIATIMLLMAFRYHRGFFITLTPIIFSLYISTFYCRYHYPTDTVIGILTAILVFRASPYLTKFWNNLASRFKVVKTK
ncbi:MAG: phosphatase PAP2 family protein [Candidatus Aminicenantes bacterium]|nr:phosphatase PAP2 family protein [Candidatus Aminicenantes bacterium]